MRKIIAVMLIPIMLTAFLGCSKHKSEYDLEVTHEKFEDMEVVNIYDKYVGYETEQAIYNISDLVVVGMLTDSFTDVESKEYGPSGNVIEEGSNDIVSSVETIRPLKVLEVLKGENVPNTINFANEAICKNSPDGTEKIYWQKDTEFIQKKNVKYIFYLNKSERQDGTYFAVPYQGVINIDELDTNGSPGNYVSEARYDEVKARFGEYFKKYDRSGGNKTNTQKTTDNTLEVSIEEFSDMNNLYPATGDYFQPVRQQTLYDRCDIAVIGTLDDSLTEGRLMEYNVTGDYDKSSYEMFPTHAILRRMTVLEVLKGDESIQSLTLVDSAIFSNFNYPESKLQTIGIYAPKKNLTYIFYLNKSQRDDGTYYISVIQKAVNIDGLDKDNYVFDELYNDVKARYPQQFEKYDRSDEIK